MDREQFYRGWLLLVSQPWGKMYQDQGSRMSDEQRATAGIQQELYFKRLSYCNPFLWESICESFATGEHWPSIDELKRAIAANSPRPRLRYWIAPQPKIKPPNHQLRVKA